MSVHHTTGRPLLGMPDDGPRCSRCHAVLAHDHDDPMCSPCMAALGIEPRKPKRRYVHTGGRRSAAAAVRDAIECAYRAGMRVADIVATRHTSPETIYAVVKERGVPLRNQWRK